MFCLYPGAVFHASGNENKVAFFLQFIIFDVVRVRWHSQQSTLCQEVRSLPMGSGVGRTRKQVGAGEDCIRVVHGKMTAVDSA